MTYTFHGPISIRRECAGIGAIGQLVLVLVLVCMYFYIKSVVYIIKILLQVLVLVFREMYVYISRIN